MTSVSYSSVPETDIDLTRSNQLQERLHELVPGGAHTYARGSDQYPEHMAPIIVSTGVCGPCTASNTAVARSTSPCKQHVQTSGGATHAIQ
mgnify:CR=1 FL=1